MQENNILVSISCITYNHEKYIEKAINSFLEQKTNFKFEILIYDDASTDNTQNIIKEYQKKYPEIIKPILSRENKYSKGLRRVTYLYNHNRARGKYVAICEGDDYWIDEYKLQKQIDYMEKNKFCTLTFHNAIKLNDTTNMYEEKMIDTMIESKKMNAGEVLNLRFIPTASTIYKKSSMNNPPKWFFNSITGDLSCNLIVSSRGYAYYFNEVMSVYRVGNCNSLMGRWKLEQNSINKKVNHINGYIELLNNFDKFTNNKFFDNSDLYRIELEFKIKSLMGDIRGVKNYRYNKLYKNLSIKSKIKIYLINISPKLYDFLYKFKI